MANRLVAERPVDHHQDTQDPDALRNQPSLSAGGCPRVSPWPAVGLPSAAEYLLVIQASGYDCPAAGHEALTLSGFGVEEIALVKCAARVQTASRTCTNSGVHPGRLHSTERRIHRQHSA